MALSPTTTLRLRDPARLTELMEQRKLSTRKLAPRVGISPARVGQLGRGEGTSIAAPSALAIAAEFDLKVTDLFDFPDGPELVRLGLI